MNKSDNTTEQNTELYWAFMLEFLVPLKYVEYSSAKWLVAFLCDSYHNINGLVLEMVDGGNRPTGFQVIWMRERWMNNFKIEMDGLAEKCFLFYKTSNPANGTVFWKEVTCYPREAEDDADNN